LSRFGLCELEVFLIATFSGDSSLRYPSKTRPARKSYLSDWSKFSPVVETLSTPFGDCLLDYSTSIAISLHQFLGTNALIKDKHVGGGLHNSAFLALEMLSLRGASDALKICL
jgi:hypothetical protein